MASLTWGGTTLALPARDGGVRASELVIGAGREMLDGSYRAHFRANKRRVTLQWEGLTASERSTLLGAWAARLVSAGTLTLPDGQSFSAMAGFDWAENHWYEGRTDTPYYNVSFTAKEV